MNKRDEILKIGLKYFSEEGYDAVGVQKIAQGAGVTKPTLYHYFNNKEGLLSAIIEESFDKFLEQLVVYCKYEGNMTRSLETIVKHYFDFAANNREVYRLILSLTYGPKMSKSSMIVEEYLRKQYRAIESVFREGAKQHGNMKGRSRIFAYSFIGVINASITYYFFSENVEDLGKEKVKELCRQFMHGIFS